MAGRWARMPRTLRALPSIADRTCVAGRHVGNHVLVQVSPCHLGIRQRGETVGVVYPNSRAASVVRAPGGRSKRQSPGKTKDLSAGGQAAKTTYAIQRRRSKMAVNIPSLHSPIAARAPHAPAAVKLNRLPAVNPSTRHNPMNPPAASRSPSSTHSPAAIMQLDPSHPFDSPKSSCMIPR